MKKLEYLSILLFFLCACFIGGNLLGRSQTKKFDREKTGINCRFLYIKLIANRKVTLHFTSKEEVLETINQCVDIFEGRND